MTTLKFLGRGLEKISFNLDDMLKLGLPKIAEKNLGIISIEEN